MGPRPKWVKDFSCPFWSFGKSYAHYETDISLVGTIGLAMGMMMFERLQQR